MTGKLFVLDVAGIVGLSKSPFQTRAGLDYSYLSGDWRREKRILVGMT